MTAAKCPQVALLVDTATDWGRRMIRGIARYAQEQGGWDIWLEQRCQRELKQTQVVLGNWDLSN
jgi:hypothetical protein